MPIVIASFDSLPQTRHRFVAHEQYYIMLFLYFVEAAKLEFVLNNKVIEFVVTGGITTSL